ncbi:hypothetical protein ACU4GG_06225 [Streptomyces nojiriensis]
MQHRLAGPRFGDPGPLLAPRALLGTQDEGQGYGGVGEQRGRFGRMRQRQYGGQRAPVVQREQQRRGALALQDGRAQPARAHLGGGAQGGRRDLRGPGDTAGFEGVTGGGRLADGGGPAGSGTVRPVGVHHPGPSAEPGGEPCEQARRSPGVGEPVEPQDVVGAGHRRIQPPRAHCAL